MGDQASNIPIQSLDYFNQPLAPYVDPNPKNPDLSQGSAVIKFVRPVDPLGASLTSKYCVIILVSAYDPITSMVTREAFIPEFIPDYNDFIIKRVINPSKDDLPDYVQVGRSYKIPRAQEAETGRTLENILHRMNDEYRKARNSKRFDGYDPVVATTSDMIVGFSQAVHVGEFKFNGKIDERKLQEQGKNQEQTRMDLQERMAPYIGIAERGNVVSIVNADFEFPRTGVLHFFGPDGRVGGLPPGKTFTGKLEEIDRDSIIFSVPVRLSATLVTNEKFRFSRPGILENVPPEKKKEVADVLKPGSDTIEISSHTDRYGAFVLDFKNVGRKQVPVVEITPGTVEIKPGWSRK